MTKHRRALTPHRALCRIADWIGWDGCAQVTGKSEWSLRKMSDPDTGRELALRDAILLDLAYRRAGGIGSPLFQAYAAALDIEASENLGSALLEVTSRAAKEAGEAVAAALDAASHAHDPASVARAVFEAEEGVEAMIGLLQRLKHSQREGKD